MTGKESICDSLPDELVETFSTADQIYVKPYFATFNTISLLKTPDEIQTAIRNEGSEW